MKADSIVDIFFFVPCWVCSVGVFFNAVLRYLGLTGHPRRYFFLKGRKKTKQLSSPSNVSSWHLKSKYVPKINSFKILVTFTYLFCFSFQAFVEETTAMHGLNCVIPFSLSWKGRPQTKASGMLEHPSSTVTEDRKPFTLSVSFLPLISVKSDPVKAFFFLFLRLLFSDSTWMQCILSSPCLPLLCSATTHFNWNPSFDVRPNPDAKLAGTVYQGGMQKRKSTPEFRFLVLH